MTAENPAFGPQGIETAYEAMARAERDAGRSVPPLDQHLKSLTIEKTRLGKVYDYLLGEQCKSLESSMNPRIFDTVAEMHDNLRKIVSIQAITLLWGLAATEGYIELPNRKRLIALVEQAMAKETTNAT